MEAFRTHIQREFQERQARNKHYSLRAFAQSLGLSHATLSSILSGRRKLTYKAAQKLATALALGPEEIARLLGTTPETQTSRPYHLVQQDAFSAISEWYFDAILELALIPRVRLSPAFIADALDISPTKAAEALATLERLELLKKDRTGRYRTQHEFSSNILDADFTSLAHRKYQRQVLEKSIEALQSVPRAERDHTSITMAIHREDLPEAKARIKKFRQELNQFLQRKEVQPNEVYQLHVGFFPLTDLKEKK